MSRRLPWGLVLLLGAGACNAQSLPAGSVLAQDLAALDGMPADPAALPPPLVRNGQRIFNDFRSGLASAQCDAAASNPRWQRQFARAPIRLGDADDDALALFGYVIDELRAAGLPTEFALIPFVESGYRPAARSASGPAGLWQFIASTARNHHVPMTKGYDGRLSAVDSTRAAVSYLKTLYGIFGGDWQLTVMAYNAGEYRVLQALRRAGMDAHNARASALPGLPPVTHAYVQKLHALACVLEQAEQQPEMMAALDRPVPILRAHPLPAGTRLADWSTANTLDVPRVAGLNPALGTVPANDVLALAPALAVAATIPAPVAAPAAADPAGNALPATTATDATARSGDKRHTVRSGESAWSIARRYRIPVQRLLSRNHLDARAVLKPGMVLRLDDPR